MGLATLLFGNAKKKSSTSKIVDEFSTNVDFAEKLFGTLAVGPRLTEEEKQACQKIWTECGNSRFKVLDKVIELCGDDQSPKARRIRASAAAWGSTANVDKIIRYNEEYLRGGIDEDAREVRNGFRNYHTAEVHVVLAKAYGNHSVKDYAKAEEHFREAINLSPRAPMYTRFAEYYRQTKRHDEAVALLENAKFKVDPEWLQRDDEDTQRKEFEDVIARRLEQERQYQANAKQSK